MQDNNKNPLYNGKGATKNLETLLNKANYNEKAYMLSAVYTNFKPVLDLMGQALAQEENFKIPKANQPNQNDAPKMFDGPEFLRGDGKNLLNDQD